jgi:hypothetical protein
MATLDISAGMIRMRHIFFFCVAATYVSLTGCGGGAGAPTSPQQQAQQRSHAEQVLREVPPPGSRVYETQGLTVSDGNRQMSFPSSASETVNASGIEVSYAGKVYHFSSKASVTRKGAVLKYVIPPGARLPSFLQTKQPSYIVH